MTTVSSITQCVTSPEFGSEPQEVKKAYKKLTEYHKMCAYSSGEMETVKSMDFGVSGEFKSLLAV